MINQTSQPDARSLSLTSNLYATLLSQKYLALSACMGLLATSMILMQVSFNFWFFLIALTGLTVALSSSLRAGALYSMAYYCIKPVFGRLAYHFDSIASSQPAVDILRYSGGLFLVLICLLIIAKHIHERRSLITTKLDMALMLFIGLNFLSIFNPHNSIFNGLAGFERNIFPTVFLFFVGKELIQTRKDLNAMLKVFGGVALVTVLFGFGHAISGVFEFETAYFNDYFAELGYDGWLTIGLNGVEFRNFSTFFGYMEFTFTLALWVSLFLALSYKTLDIRWIRFKWVFGALSVALLALTMERTPIMMVIIAILGAWFIRSEKEKRKTIVMYSTVVFATIIAVTALFQRQLEITGIAKLQRLAEMADPSSVSSIDDRMQRMWIPTVGIIAGNPMGVGVGYGSETIARGSAGGFHVQPHNEFLQKALETGILGAFLFAAILWMIFRNLQRLSESSEDKFIKSATAAGCGILIAFVACAQVNLPFSGAQGCFFWFVSGALLSVGARSQSNDVQRRLSE